GIGVVTAQAVRNGALPAAGEDAAGASELAARHEITQPGDILVTTTPDIRAVVDPDGGRLIGGGGFRLRVDSRVCDTSFVAYSLMGRWNERHLAGTAPGRRADVRALEIPLVPIAEQRRIAALLESVHTIRRQAESIAEAAQNVAGDLLDCVRHGAT